MAKNKTIPTDADVSNYIATVENPQQREDSKCLVRLLQEITGESPYMWGPSIIGFGSYHYKYASGHEGDAPLLGFSPRKTATSLYIYSETEENKKLLLSLGKYKMGKVCIYVKKLSDVDESVMRKIAENSIHYIQKRYPNHE